MITGLTGFVLSLLNFCLEEPKRRHFITNNESFEGQNTTTKLVRIIPS
jgi:hypothetical protein